jgi:hypothetical protein
MNITVTFLSENTVQHTGSQSLMIDGPAKQQWDFWVLISYMAHMVQYKKKA